MKKLLFMMAVLLFPGLAMAEELSLEDFPALKQGVAWSFADSNLNYLSTVELVTHKGFALEAGYAGAAKETGNKAVAVFSYDLLKLKDLIDMPILKYIEFRPGIWAGIGRITGSNEFDYGVSATIISVKF